MRITMRRNRTVRHTMYRSFTKLGICSALAVVLVMVVIIVLERRPALGLLAAAVAVDPIIAAAGDIACDAVDPEFNAGAGTPTRCRERDTSNLLVGAGLAAVLPLGDNQQVCGSAQRFADVYQPTWARALTVTHPVL